MGHACRVVLVAALVSSLLPANRASASTAPEQWEDVAQPQQQWPRADRCLLQAASKPGPALVAYEGDPTPMHVNPPPQGGHDAAQRPAALPAGVSPLQGGAPTALPGRSLASLVAVAKRTASRVAADFLPGAAARTLALARVVPDDDPPKGQDLVKANAFRATLVAICKKLVAASVYIVLVCSIAFVYDKFYRMEALEAGSPMKPPGIEERPTTTFRFSLCDCDGCCGRDLKICLCAFCCSPIRWADTLSQTKLGLGYGFWALLFFATICTSLDEMTLGVTAFVYLAVAVFCRQRLRAAFGLVHSTFGTYCKDCLVWACCFPCAAAQEAREVEYLPILRSS